MPILSTSQLLLLIPVFIWSIVWKGIALWKSARLSHKKWFVILLVTNTFGILEIIYLRFVARKYSVEVVEETAVIEDDRVNE